MSCKIARWGLSLASLVATVTGLAWAQATAERGPISVAVTEPDIQVIVAAVGGKEVDTFSLFRGCILREDLNVEPAVQNRLAKASAVVWTGFLNESAAITSSLHGSTSGAKWIDVSKGAARTIAPASNCYGYVDPKLMSGDPFFWLYPKNGSIIARNIAEGLSALRPEKRTFFFASADAFTTALEKDISRWKQDLKPLGHLRVFSAQCGWQNFAKLGGPAFAVCKGTPGVLPTPDVLVERVKELKAQLVIVDPIRRRNTARLFVSGRESR